MRQLPRAQGPNDIAVRALRKAGLDPDLPPPPLHHLTMISSPWGFPDAQAREYTEALASEDMEAPRRLLRRGRAFLARTRPELLRAVQAAFRPAPVPSIDVLPPVQEMPDRAAAARSAARPDGPGAAHAGAQTAGSRRLPAVTGRSGLVVNLGHSEERP